MSQRISKIPRPSLFNSGNMAWNTFCKNAFCYGMIVAVAGLLNGCANSSHMFMVQETHLGVVGAVNPANNTAKVNIGYSRKFAAVIPKVNRVDDATIAPTTPTGSRNV